MVSWFGKSTDFMFQVHSCVHNGLQVDPVLRQVTLVHILMAFFSKIHFNAITYIQGAAEITPTFGGVTARAVEGVQ